MTKKIHMAGPSITDLEVDTVVDAMKNGWYEHAYDYVEKFEREFARYHDRKYALMTPNCTAAIHLTLMGLGVGPTDEVIVPDCTWIATAAPITYTGARPVFADIEAQNWCLSPKSLQQKITPHTKAIIVVDLYGNMPLMQEIRAIAQEHQIPLVEDAAEALGSSFNGIKAGKFGIASVFSFHRTKTLTTGEGGMFLTDSPELYERCKFLRDHGRKEGEAYFNTEVGYKYMPFNVQAALGYAQLQRLEELVGKKRQIFSWYQNQLSSMRGITLNAEPKGVYNSYWCTTAVFDSDLKINKKDILNKMAAIDLPIRPFFYPLSSLPAFKKWSGDEELTNTQAYDISNRGVNLPSALNIDEADVEKICDGLKKVLSKI